MTNKDNGGPARERELLEMAAKAYLRAEHLSCDAYMAGFMANWNPLTDHGDAMRMAVELHLQITIYGHCVLVCKLGDELWHQNFLAQEQRGDDLHYATRRAIVRAAAAIGSAM